MHRLFTALLVSTVASFAQTPAPAPAKPATDETILLNPFDVTAGSTKGYMATNTISGTAMNNAPSPNPTGMAMMTKPRLMPSI